MKKCKGSKELGEAVTERAAKLLKKWKKAVTAPSNETNNNSQASAASAAQTAVAPAASAAAAAAVAAPAAAPAAAAADAPKPKADGTTVEECLGDEEVGAVRDLPAPRLKIANLLLGVFLKHDVGREERQVRANGYVHCVSQPRVWWFTYSVHGGMRLHFLG